ncbi:8710_t:CDS:2, partial [Funneliformis caledonium]
AELIADYESLEKPTGNRRGNPRYIYYVGTPEYQAQWLDKAEKYRKSHKTLSFLDENLLKIHDEMKKMKEDVAAKFNSVEMTIKELLSSIKSK